MINPSLAAAGPEPSPGDLLWHKVPKASASLPTELCQWLGGQGTLTLPWAQAYELVHMTDCSKFHFISKYYYGA